MLSDNSFSLACRRIREHMASIVPAIMQRKPQPIPTTVLRTVDLRHTRSFVDSLAPRKTIRSKLNALRQIDLGTSKSIKVPFRSAVVEFWKYSVSASPSWSTRNDWKRFTFSDKLVAAVVGPPISGSERFATFLAFLQ